MNRRVVLGTVALHVVVAVMVIVFPSVQAEFQWAWMSGTNGYTWVTPNYVDKGVASSTANPGSRESHAGWFDPETREYWLYGGNVLCS